jgi:hypothetical protein
LVSPQRCNGFETGLKDACTAAACFVTLNGSFALS